MTALATYPKLGGPGDLLGSYRLVTNTGLVTAVATRTSTLGQLLAWRRSSTATTRCEIGYIGAKFTCTTAYTTAQRTGVDLIVARAYTASASGGTAIDMGSTVTKTGALATAFPASIVGVANTVRVATTDGMTSGTQTLDANPIGALVAWTGAVGDQIPAAASGKEFGTLFGKPHSEGGNPAPLILAADEGFLIRNYILMGATGVGVWDFIVEWNETAPR